MIYELSDQVIKVSLSVIGRPTEGRIQWLVVYAKYIK